MTKKNYKESKAIYKDRNKRFIMMRKHFFKTQAEAAEFLGITQTMVSYMEQGINDVNPSFIDKFVKDLHVSRQWYNEGIGAMTTDGKEKPKDLLTNIADLIARTEQLEHQIDRLEKREKATFRELQAIKKLLEGREK